MKAFGTRARGSLAALLSAALITSGALLAAPAAYADEGVPPTDAQATEVTTETVESTPEAEPESEPAEDSSEDQAPAQEESADEGAPAEDAPAEEPAEEAQESSAAELEQIAAEATVTIGHVEVTDKSELKVDVEVDGLPGGIYAALIERGTESSLDMDGGYAAFAFPFPTVTEGASNFSLTAPADKLDRSKEYEVLVWQQHTMPDESTIYGRADVEVSKEDWNKLFPVAGPKLSVSKSTGLDPAGETVVVSGTGYDPAKPIYVFLCEDVDLPANLWNLAMGCRDGSKLVYASTDDDDSHVKFAADGSFEVSMDVKQLNGGATSVYTASNHVNPTDRSQDAKMTLEFATAGPQLSVTTSIPDEDTVSITVNGAGFEDVKALPGQAAPSVYLALIEKGMDLSEFSQESSLPFTAVDVDEGEFSGTLEAEAETLDRSKLYEVISWPSRSNPSEETVYARADVAIDWDELSPVTPPSGSAKVTSATTAGLKVSANLKNVTAEAYPQGLNFAIVKRGTASGASSLIGDAVSKVKPTASKTAAAQLSAPRAKLDRAQQYEVAVWSGGSMPTRSNLVKVLPFDVSANQWSAVFPASKPTPSAGSLTWGVSTQFADYINSNIAKGSVSTSGVGGGRGGYVFPQATDSNWNAQTRTGSVQYRGSVTFKGHETPKGSGNWLINMTFANPVITVNSPTSGSIAAGGQTFPLDLIGANFTANPDGSVTWSNVGVIGVISGGDGGGAGGSVSMDGLSFTVGSASSANYGSTTVTSPFAKKREPAKTPPATTGLKVLTSDDEIIAGGEIEIEASGFEPNEQGILVVLYPDAKDAKIVKDADAAEGAKQSAEAADDPGTDADGATTVSLAAPSKIAPITLDDKAKADADGKVHWIGKLPKDLVGKHTITLQGSINVGKEITILAADQVVKELTATASTTSQPAQSGEFTSETGGMPVWIWWAIAIALVVIAGGLTALLIAQRNRAPAGPTYL